MGGGLTFLNKKTWHPGRMQNQERLWKAEEEAAKEARQLAELQKKLQDERGREELKAAAIAGGHQKVSDRLDWMYQGGMVAKADADKRNEEAMLGNAPIAPLSAEEQEASRLEQATLLPTFYAEDTPAAANETWNRLHADPLFAIRQQEQSARKQVVANPVQMLAIKKQVEALKQQALEKKLAKKAAKEAKKAKKHGKKEKDASKDVVVPAPPHSRCSASPAAPDARHHGSHHHRHHSSHGYDGAADHNRSSNADGHRSSHGEPDSRHHGRAEEPRQRDSSGRHSHRGDERHHSSRHRDREGDVPENGHHHAAKRQRRSRSRTAEPQARSRQENGHTQADNRARHHIDSASAQGSGIQYGLNTSQHQSDDRREHAEATRKRLEQAAKLKEEADRAAAEGRHVRKDYKTGKLTAEEKAARLAEMQGNASERDATRSTRLGQEAEKHNGDEGEAGQRHHTDSARFMKTMTQEVYGATGDGGSLEDRVTRRKYYIERRPAEDKAAFRR